MFYYIYKITNINNGKFYVGSHKTENLNDEYFGSGIYLKRFIQQHGKENFKKEILSYHNSLEEMLAAENALLNDIKNTDTYNLKYCAMGGNTKVKYNIDEKKKYIDKLVANPASPIGKKGNKNFMFGKKHSNEYKEFRRHQQAQYYKDLKINNPEKYSRWYNLIVPQSIARCYLNAIKRSKPIIYVNKQTCEQKRFKSITECVKALKITPITVHRMIKNPLLTDLYTLTLANKPQ